MGGERGEGAVRALGAVGAVSAVGAGGAGGLCWGSNRTSSLSFAYFLQAKRKTCGRAVGMEACARWRRWV